MNIQYQITFYSDWHCGSGLSSGTDVDLLVIKDKAGLPYVPGKTIKGLLREALLEIDSLSGNSNLELIKKLLGVEETGKGKCFFTNATLSEDLEKTIVTNNLQKYLYRTIASTSIDKDGIAVDASLRKMQVTVPCVLEGKILDIPIENGEEEFLKQFFLQGLRFIKRLGQNRNRGLGNCSFSAVEEVLEKDSNNKDVSFYPGDQVLIFKCKLLTDIVLNQRAATEGNQESLDFIPGSNFLGIAAGTLYKNDKNSKPEQLEMNDCLKIFHSKKVRFGDAHPAKGNKRSFRVPASMYYPKLKDKEGLYIHHEVDPNDKEFKAFQPKQCRTGFYLFENKEALKVEVNKSFAIKSAYDKKYRRSKDQKMYGYESLQPGSEWIFEVYFDQTIPAELIEKVKTALEGKRRVGRSRTAQYGLVDITYLSHNISAIKIISPKQHSKKESFVLVYADSRLIFMDEYGLPTFQPKAKDFGFPEGSTIDWEKSQIRTFQYAPWNFKRQVRDTDRCGIEKGSVFYIKHETEIELSEYVGFYQNEGFGKVIFNPDFLDIEEKSKGKSIYKFKKEEKTSLNKQEENTSQNRKPLDIGDSDNTLLKFLKNEYNQEILDAGIYNLVNDFVDKELKQQLFKGDSFASQWGSIRSIAMQKRTKTDLDNALFAKKSGYLKHGVAKDKWEVRGRLSVFEEFGGQLTDENAQIAVINLCAEMAKLKYEGGNK